MGCCAGHVCCAAAALRTPCAGAHILYRPGPNHAPQPGRIIRTGDGIATITTTAATAEASVDQLAPYLPSGSEVMISIPLSAGAGGAHAPGVIDAPPGGLPPGRTIPATVLRDDSTTTWPPHYTVRLPDASSATVMHSLFTAVTMPPGAGGGPRQGAGRFGSPMPGEPDDLPSAPPTLPGAPPPYPAASFTCIGGTVALSLGMVVLVAVSGTCKSQQVWWFGSVR